MKKARELIEGLPGGEMLPTDQDEVIKFLEEVKQQKRYWLSISIKVLRSLSFANTEIRSLNS
jgi:hypothetical protein